MPKRMIDGGITTSDSLNRVSLQAVATFFFLMSLCCDRGRYDGRPDVLRAHLYPRRPRLRESQIMGWLEELEAEGCIHFYVVEGKRYIHYPSWEKFQRLRESRAKWPDPKGNCDACGELPQVAASRGELPPEVEVEVEVEARSKTVAASASTHPPEWSLQSADLLIELLRDVPGASIKKGARTAWAREIAKIPQECPQDFRECLYVEVIEAAIHWALGPENLGIGRYEIVIRSGRSLREKWPQLVAGARRVRAETQPKEDFDKFVEDLAAGGSGVV